MTVDMLPGLKVVADEDGIETDLLGKAREAQQSAWRKLLCRCLVSELDHPHLSSPASVESDAMVPVAEIYRLAENQ
jgi:hypothetical protein